MIKKILTFIGIFLLIICVMGAGFLYKIDYKKTEIKSSVSDDKNYTLTVYEIGEPEFAFGSANCRFVLKNNDKKISTLDFEIRNDGGWALPQNVDIKWQDNCAVAYVNGEEQEDTIYYLYFDGKTKEVQNPNN